MSVHHLRNDHTPHLRREVSALELVLKAIEWAMSRFQERGRLPPEERAAKALEYERAAERCAAATECRMSMLVLAGRYAEASQVLRATN